MDGTTRCSSLTLECEEHEQIINYGKVKEYILNDMNGCVSVLWVSSRYPLWRHGAMPLVT
jgi:hypothetical protein